MDNEQLSRLYNDSVRHENPGHLMALQRIYEAGQAAGIAAERERCARIVMEHAEVDAPSSRAIYAVLAAAIRADREPVQGDAKLSGNRETETETEISETVGVYREPEPATESAPLDGGPGWYEWLADGVSTTHVAYVHENGDVYDPERGWNPEAFTLAAARGRVFKLVRSVPATEEGSNRG